MVKLWYYVQGDSIGTDAEVEDLMTMPPSDT